MCHHTSDLIEKVTSHLPWHWSLINQPQSEVWILNFTFHLWSFPSVKYISLYIPTLFRSTFISPDKDLLFEAETSWVNFFVHFTTGDQSNFQHIYHNQVIKMNLFNNLNHRYGQSYIKEVRSCEGKEHKFTRYRCHLHFNLRCLSENIVSKGVKLNLKQFDSIKKKQILCKTHRSILNSHIKQCNNVIKNLMSQISKIREDIRSKSSGNISVIPITK